jgi:hypothetical protein
MAQDQPSQVQRVESPQQASQRVQNNVLQKLAASKTRYPQLNFY